MDNMMESPSHSILNHQKNNKRYTLNQQSICTVLIVHLARDLTLTFSTSQNLDFFFRCDTMRCPRRGEVNPIKRVGQGRFSALCVESWKVMEKGNNSMVERYIAQQLYQ